MKTIVLGDTHGRPHWKQIVDQDFDKIIFIGDYFDSFEYTAEEQIQNFLDIVEYKKTGGKRVHLLIGNHDHHYFKDIGNTGTSGYQVNKAFMIGEVLEANRKYLQMATFHGDVLFTHAGVGETWLEDNSPEYDEDNISAQFIAGQVNEVWKYKPRNFTFTGMERSGDDIGQTPIWIRPRSLMKDSQDWRDHLIQVVGHTGMKSIDIEGKSTGGRYFFIDTLEYSGEYLIIEDAKMRVGKYDKGEEK